MKYIITVIAMLASSAAYAVCDPSIQLGAKTSETHGILSEQFSITLNIPLNKSKCDRIESDRRAKAQADLLDKELRNIERIIVMCTRYPDSPLLAGKCK